MTASLPALFDPEGFAPLYELPGARARLPGIIDLFLTEAASLLQQALVALAAEDLRTLERAAHGLRGSSSLVGANRLCSDAESLELAACEQRRAELAPRLERALSTLEQTRPLLLAAARQPLPAR